LPCLGISITGLLASGDGQFNGLLNDHQNTVTGLLASGDDQFNGLLNDHQNTTHYCFVQA
jgi:hypothetical protein